MAPPKKMTKPRPPPKDCVMPVATPNQAPKTVGGIVNIFVGSTAGMMALSVAAIGIFSAYMLYDLKQILDGGETNYISATLMLYMDLFNVFQSLLALLGIMGGERD